MEIKIKFRGDVYSLCFGKQTPWFSQEKFFTIIRVDYENMKVVYAKVIR